jgi:hypothetical protein
MTTSKVTRSQPQIIGECYQLELINERCLYAAPPAGNEAHDGELEISQPATRE